MSRTARGRRIVEAVAEEGFMRSVTYSMGVSLDGYIVGPDGTFAWTAPDKDVFRFWIEEIRGVGVHLMGRRLYETMLYWETADDLDDDARAWAEVWNPLPKLVFSRTLPTVEGNARLATGTLAEEIARLPAGEIAIGGATLAHEAARLGLIDEYCPRVSPVLLGGGIPFFAHAGTRVHLELVERRAFPSGIVCLRYGVVD
jgi:dihydrofolate reductase